MNSNVENSENLVKRSEYFVCCPKCKQMNFVTVQVVETDEEQEQLYYKFLCTCKFCKVEFYHSHWEVLKEGRWLVDTKSAVDEIIAVEQAKKEWVVVWELPAKHIGDRTRRANIVTEAETEEQAIENVMAFAQGGNLIKVFENPQLIPGEVMKELETRNRQHQEASRKIMELIDQLKHHEEVIEALQWDNDQLVSTLQWLQDSLKGLENTDMTHAEKRGVMKLIAEQVRACLLKTHIMPNKVSGEIGDIPF